MKTKQARLKKSQKEFKNALINDGLDENYAHILALRNVESVEEAKYQYKLIPTDTLKGIDILAQKLGDAILQDKKISIVADYDCDGATSCSIAYLGLKQLGVKHLNFIVPNRFKHGYGLSRSVIDDLLEEKGKPDVIITVDNGIAAHDGVNYAKSLGIDVLVTDHHLPIKDYPNPIADALVNPNQDGDTSGLNNMAGCGVIFYCLIETNKYLVSKGKENQNLLHLLDLVSLGTIADVVKLDKNNRRIVKQGLYYLHNNKTREGMKALFQIARKNVYNATSLDYGFSIGPRLNAAGRLEDMSIGIQCLLENDRDKANDLAQKLNQWNEQRKSIENEMKNIALDIMESEQQEDLFTRVVYNDSYHEGVIGIVAGRIKEKENCPTIVFSPMEEDDLIKGSGRSIPQVHLRDAIDLVFKQDPSIFKSFGGHSMAAGLTIYKDKLDLFKQKFEDVVKGILNNKKVTKDLVYDLKISPKDITQDFANLINNEVWGQGFPQPIFKSELTLLEQSIRESKITNEKTHSFFIFEENGLLGWFFNHIEEYDVNKKLTVYFSLSMFNNQPSLNIIHIERT